MYRINVLISCLAVNNLRRIVRKILTLIFLLFLFYEVYLDIFDFEFNDIGNSFFVYFNNTSLEVSLFKLLFKTSSVVVKSKYISSISKT